jgi:hypothetical protein
MGQAGGTGGNGCQMDALRLDGKEGVDVGTFSRLKVAVTGDKGRTCPRFPGNSGSRRAKNPLQMRQIHHALHADPVVR